MNDGLQLTEEEVAYLRELGFNDDVILAPLRVFPPAPPQPEAPQPNPPQPEPPQPALQRGLSQATGPSRGRKRVRRNVVVQENRDDVEEEVDDDEMEEEDRDDLEARDERHMSQPDQPRTSDVGREPSVQQVAEDPILEKISKMIDEKVGKMIDEATEKILDVVERRLDAQDVVLKRHTLMLNHLCEREKHRRGHVIGSGAGDGSGAGPTGFSGAGDSSGAAGGAWPGGGSGPGGGSMPQVQQGTQIQQDTVGESGQSSILIHAPDLNLLENERFEGLWKPASDRLTLTDKLLEEYRKVRNSKKVPKYFKHRSYYEALELWLNDKHVEELIKSKRQARKRKLPVGGESVEDSFLEFQTLVSECSFQGLTVEVAWRRWKDIHDNLNFDIYEPRVQHMVKGNNF